MVARHLTVVFHHHIDVLLGVDFPQFFHFLLKLFQTTFVIVGRHNLDFLIIGGVYHETFFVKHGYVASNLSDGTKKIEIKNYY